MSDEVASATHVGMTRLVLPAADSAAESFADAVCDYLEKQYQQGQGTSLRSVIDQVPREHSPDVFTHAIELELNHRVDLGELPKPEEYVRDFLEFEPIVRHEFRQRQLAEFFLGRQIGHGGMGCVYKALHTRLRKVVAVKRLHDEQMHDAERRERFEREMQAAGRLDHPNVVRAEHAGDVSGVYFLAMEYIDGIDLSDLVERYGRLKPADACAIASAAASALGYAHDHGLVHRDVKPHNLMLNRAGQVKLLDLGLARMQCYGATTGLTMGGQGFGTVDYMAPEQFKDASRVTRHADVYSLGCTLFHLLAGRAPFGSPNYESLYAKMTAHVEAPVPDLAAECPGIPRELSAMVARMMAKQPEDRFDRMDDVKRALAPFAATANLESLAADERWAAGGVITRSTASRLRGQVTTQRFLADTDRESGRKLVWRRLIRDKRVLAALVIALAGIAAAVFFAVRPGRYAAVEAHLATLPGLHGQWWFDETPWLIPEVRKRITGAISGENGSAQAAFADSRDNLQALNAQLKSGDAEAASETLRTLATSFFAADNVENNSILKGLDDNDKSPDEMLQKLAEVRDVLVARGDVRVRDNKDAQANATILPPATEAAERLSATDCHLLAVVLHKLARHGGQSPADEANQAQSPAVSRDDLWREAEQVYQRALAKYDATDDAAMASLAPLCRADLGELYSDRGDFSTSADEFDNARVRVTSPHHLIYALCSEAGARAAVNQIFTARELLEQAAHQANRLAETDPLRGYVLERTAWFYMDCWDPDKAEEYFDRAIQARSQKARPGTDAQRLLFHDQHGKAMVLQYRKREPDTHEARRDFTALLSALDEEMRETFTKQKPRRAIINRKLNTMVREADCYLFNDPQDARRAAELYAKAAEFIREHAASIDDAAGLPSVLFLQSLALSVAGDSASAAQLFGEGEAAWKPLAAGERQRHELLRCVAGSLARGSSATSSGFDLAQLLTARAQKAKSAKGERPRLNRDEDQLVGLYCAQSKIDKQQLLRSSGVRGVIEQ